MFKKLFLLLAISISVYGGVEKPKDYDKSFISALKMAKRKNKVPHRIPGVDFIYVITAKKCHRFNDLMRSFSKYGINPYRFTAFSAKDLYANTMYRTCLRGKRGWREFEGNRLVARGGKFVFDSRKMCNPKEGYVNRKMSIKSLSRALSHISIIRDALESGYETIWIMDSATEIRRDPNVLSTYIERANTEIPDWTSLYTDYSERDEADQLKTPTKFYLRPDISFYKPDFYLARTQEQSDAHSNFDSVVNKSCARNFMEGVHELRACEQWRQNHPEENSGGDGATGPSDQPGGSNNSYEGNKGNTRARVDFIVQNKRPIVSDPSDSDVGEQFIQVGLLKGAHSYVLNRKGMKLIMDYYLDHKIFIPYAQEIQIIPGMNPYYIPEPITKNQNKG